MGSIIQIHFHVGCEIVGSSAQLCIYTILVRKHRLWRLPSFLLCFHLVVPFGEDFPSIAAVDKYAQRAHDCD